MDEETKKLIEAEVKKATEGLSNKNEELIKELKAAKGDLSKFNDVDIAKLQEDSKKLAEIEKKKLEADGEYEKMYKKAVKDHQEEVSKLSGEKNDIQAKLVQTVKENALATALVGVKVIPELSQVAITSLMGEVSINDEGVAVVGSKPVKDFVKKWAESDVGKHFIMDGNSGGGGRGSGGGHTVEEAKYYDKKSKEYNVTKQAEVANKDPELHKQLTKQYGSSA